MVAFSPSNWLLMSGSHDEAVRLWDMMTGTLVRVLKGHSFTVCVVSFSLDDRLLASGAEDKTVRLWDVTMGAPVQVLEGDFNVVQWVV